MNVMTATPIHGPAAWRGEDLRRTTDWIWAIRDAWLSMPNSRALPEGSEALWGSIETGAPRGGIAQPIGGRA